MEDGLRMVGYGGCEAWPLPGDPTCAGIARRTYRLVAGKLSLDPALIDDGVTIVSELAANTLHVRGEESRGGAELWLYMRGGGASRELVCKVFDPYPGWLNGAPSGHVRGAPDALCGRGLGVVHELSGGHWGYHLTRARLAGWNVRGKAVWFAVPVTAPEAASARTQPGTGTAGAANWAANGAPNGSANGSVNGIPAPRPPMTASEAMGELEAGLAARGFGSTLVRADDRAGDMAVLSVCNGVTLWCRHGVVWLRAKGISDQRYGYGDLVELTEQTVEAYETLVGDTETPQLAVVSS